jgi:hypothetical protein
MSDAPVEQREAAANHGIAGAGEPAVLLRGHAVDVAPQCVDKKSFRQFREHGFAPHSSRRGLFDQVEN